MGSSSLRRTASSLRPTLLLLGLLVLTGCPLEFADLDEPRVLSMTIAPSSISQSQTGSTDDYFSIEISVINFDDVPEYANVFIQARPGQPERFSASQSAHIEGNLILIDDINYSWFQGYGPGTYDIGVEIESATVSLIQNNRATVTITE